MTERKTLNRYYPVDYDPAKIPKLKGKQKEQNRLWGIRVMAPFNMRCNTCGDYIYKGKKFNSKKETVQNEDYLGIEIHRFYIRCPKCVAVIAFKTDPENCDYTLETGATRNFEAAKTLLEMEKKKQQAVEDEEAANPMKVLENRTKQSRNEMDTMEALTELREMNARHEKVDHEAMIKKAQLFQKELERLQKEEEDRLVKEVFGSEVNKNGIRRIESDEEDEEHEIIPSKKRKTDETPSTSKPTDLLADDQITYKNLSAKSLPHKKPQNSKSLLSNLVKITKPSNSKGASSKLAASSDPGTVEPSTSASASTSAPASTSLTTDNGSNNTEQSACASVLGKPTGALGMLGNYSCSSDNSSDND